MISEAERERIRKHAVAEAASAPPPTESQMAQLTTLLGAPTAEAAAQRKTAEQDAARGAA